MSWFKCIGIWPFNPRAMDSKIGFSIAYTLQNLAREEEKSEQEDGEQDWTKHTTAEQLINIGSTIKVSITDLFKDQPKYYVNMPTIPIVTNHASVIESENIVENLAQPSLDESTKF